MEPKATGELPTLVGDDGEARAGGADRLTLPARYVDLGLLGSGAFGEVRRVRDVHLDRVLVLKLLLPELAGVGPVRWRFSAEARVTAALQHPGVVPVYDHGELPDGRLWYAMKEVRGRTFAAILAELHAAATPAGFGASAGGWTFRRVVDAFARARHAYDAVVGAADSIQVALGDPGRRRRRRPAEFHADSARFEEAALREENHASDPALLAARLGLGPVARVPPLPAPPAVPSSLPPR